MSSIDSARSNTSDGDDDFDFAVFDSSSFDNWVVPGGGGDDGGNNNEVEESFADLEENRSPDAIDDMLESRSWSSNSSMDIFNIGNGNEGTAAAVRATNGRLKSLDDSYLTDDNFLDHRDSNHNNKNSMKNESAHSIQWYQLGGMPDLQSSSNFSFRGSSHHSNHSSKSLKDILGASSTHSATSMKLYDDESSFAGDNDGDDHNEVAIETTYTNKKIRFAPTLATNIEDVDNSSLNTLDVFDDNLDQDGSSSHLSSFADEDDEESIASEESKESQEGNIKRQMLYALGGVGLFAFVGFAFKKIMNRLSNDQDLDAGADVTNVADVADAASNINDVATLAAGGDGGSSAAASAATEAANQAAFHASASQSQSGFVAFGTAAGNQGATATMTAAQTQVLQSMAVSAASNAASSAASASTALSTAAATAAGVGAGAAVTSAASISTIATIVSCLLVCDVFKTDSCL